MVIATILRAVISVSAMWVSQEMEITAQVNNNSRMRIAGYVRGAKIV